MVIFRNLKQFPPPQSVTLLSMSICNYVLVLKLKTNFFFLIYMMIPTERPPLVGKVSANFC
jgi:hypothetical protein